MTDSAQPWQRASVVFAGDAARAVLSRAVSAGRLQRIARGIYIPAADDPVAVVAREWLSILGRTYPGAIIADRSARSMRPVDGRLYVVHPRRSSLELPGLRIVPRAGSGPAPGDIAGPHGIWMSSIERGLLDNLTDRARRTMERDSVERWVGDVIARSGVVAINEIRDRAREIADVLGRRVAFRRLDTLIGAALATGPTSGLRSAGARRPGYGLLVDERRIAMFRTLATHLADEPPRLLPVLDPSARRHVLLPFYEAYFSNFIEGTTFTLDEASDIVFADVRPMGRPEDAHDVLGTYRLASDPNEMARRAATGADLVRQLTEWHGTLMGGRPEVDPGRFRDVQVQADSTVFVRHELVRATLEVGFDLGSSISDSFGRAVFIHFLVSETHPFRDGNGRISRLAMNAALSGAGETRIIIPTGFRDEYLQALKAASNLGRFEATIAVLDFARRWTAQMDFSSRTVAEPMLRATNALADPFEVRANNLRLRLPSRVSDEDLGL